MHLRITLKGKSGPIRLPIHYNRLIQGAIYSSLSEALAEFFHNMGFTSGKRSLKLFTFSRLLGRFDIRREKGEILFPQGATLIVSSPIAVFCESLTTGILREGTLRLGGEDVEVNSIEGRELLVESNESILRVLSPIVTYSTMFRPDGRKYTCYFQPGEEEFQTQIWENLRKKYELLYREPAPQGGISIKPLGQPRMNIVIYENTVIKGYSCRLAVSGPKELIQIGVDAGFGSKNSQGFGCVEVEGGSAYKDLLQSWEEV